jgi:excisionase family DNA binding protein
VFSDIERNWMLVSQAAEELNVSTRHVRLLIARGVLRGSPVNSRLWLVERESVEAYKRERRPVGRPRRGSDGDAGR